MTEEAEHVGGISVSAGIDDSAIDAQLDSWLAKLQAAAVEAQRILTVSVAVQPGPSVARAEPVSPQAVVAPRPERPPVTAVAQYPNAAPHIQAQLAAADAGAAAQTGRLAGETRKAESFREPAPEPPPQAITTKAATINAAQVNVTNAEQSTASLDALTASVSALTAAIEKLQAVSDQPVTVRARPDESVQATEEVLDARPARRGQRRAAPPAVEMAEEEPEEQPKRRRTLRARDVDTTADPNRIYTYGAEEAGGMTEPGPFQSGPAYTSGGNEDELAERRRQVAAGRAQDRDTTRREVAARKAQAAEDKAALRGQETFGEEQMRFVLGTPGEGEGPATSRTFDIHEAPPPPQAIQSNRTSAQQEASRRARAEQAAAAAREQERVRRARAEAPGDEEISATLQRLQRQRVVDVQEEEIQRRVQSRRTAITASGRTGRTAAFGIGTLFGGTQGAQIEAQTRASAAARNLARAEAPVADIERTLASRDQAISVAVGKNKQYLQSQREAFLRQPEVITAIQRHKEAILEDAKAQEQLIKLQGPGSIARNFLAGAAGGAAFGLALQGIAFAANTVGPALGKAIDQATGFGATSTKATSDLAQQTQAMHGNVQAVIAQSAAQAGLSSTAAQYLDTQLRLTTQIKAGALAQGQTSELFRAGAGRGQAPQGLFGGFGGLFGSPFLASEMGGGKGFTEQVAGDIGALRQGPQAQGGAGPLDYLTNQSFRDFVNQQGHEQGSALGPISDLIGGIGDLLAAPAGDAGTFGKPSPAAQGQFTGAPRSDALDAYINDLNDAAKRGIDSQGKTAQVSLDYAKSLDEVTRASTTAAQAGDTAGVQLAQMGIVLRDLNGKVITDVKQYQDAITQFATGKSRPDIQTLLAVQKPAIAAQGRALEAQQQVTLQRQLPAQAALQNLAAPPTPVGTGITAADQRSVQGVLKDTLDIQKQLDAYYQQGADILKNEYHVPPQLLNDVRATGQAIAETQASISNEQAGLQAAQYNEQLRIARRSYTDILQLTGQIGRSTGDNLGMYERANLLLGRQAQQLQFTLSQRQINFQTALAGFQAPGVTPEERRARMEEAKIEASFAQKQLDLSKAQFGNQIKIVDISNLRQATDLFNQIGLLTRGRQVAIDTAAAEQKIQRLSVLQQQQVAQVQTYVNKVDTLTSNAISNIADIEAQVGHAISKTEIAGVAAAYNVGLAFYKGITGSGYLTDVQQSQNQREGPSGPIGPHASGIVGTARSATTMTVGEAGNEEVAILRNPRSMALGGGGDGGRGGDVIFNGDIVVRNDADIDMIARKVEEAMGRKASLIGLRSPG